MVERDFPARCLRSFGAREPIFDEGSAAAHMYVVQAGAVEIRKAGAGAAPLVVLRKGDMFGEMALVDGSPRSASAAAGPEGATVLEIDHALFVYVVGQQPAFALMVMQSMARRLRERTGAPA